jgi:hypothetical protein
MKESQGNILGCEEETVERKISLAQSKRKMHKTEANNQVRKIIAENKGPSMYAEACL